MRTTGVGSSLLNLILSVALLLSGASLAAEPVQVVNQGRITASEGGRAYLVGKADYQGVITAPNGDIVLAAGKSVRVTEGKTPGVQVEITAPGDSAINLSELAYGSGGIYAGLVKNSGVVSADTAVRGADGSIILKASNGVALESGSRVSAIGIDGGHIVVDAQQDTAVVSGSVEAAGSAGHDGSVAIQGNAAVSGSVEAAGSAGHGGSIAIDEAEVAAANKGTQVQRQQDQPYNNAPVWREVRSGQENYTNIKGVETGVLVQSGGETWRELRNGPVTFYGCILLIAIPVLIFLYYRKYGPLKLHGKPTGRLIQRFFNCSRSSQSGEKPIHDNCDSVRNS